MKWMKTGPYPLAIGICIEGRGWRSEMKRLGPDCANSEFSMGPEHVAWLSIFKQPTGARVLIVCFGEGFRKEPLKAKLSAAVHEATHVWQQIEDHITEHDAGYEIEACTVQWISDWLWTELHAAGLLGGTLK